MAVPRCPICGREVTIHSTKHGTIVVCECGLSSKLFKGNGDAERWIRTKDGIAPPRVEVGAPIEKKALRV